MNRVKKSSKFGFNTYSDLINLFFPRVCISCGEVLNRHDEYICLKCLVHLPRTNFHAERGNKVEQVFWGRVPIEKATSYFYFNKGSNYQRLLHELKYRGNYELGVYLAKNYAEEIIRSGFFKSIDYIVPVPLHPKKLKKRGYNQSLSIAEGLHVATNIPILHSNLIRTAYNATQTHKGRYDRWENVNEIFDVLNPEHFIGRHILLVDDVVTTGATLEACALKILASVNSKVSILTLAYA